MNLISGPLRGLSPVGGPFPTCATVNSRLFLSSHQWDCVGSNCILYLETFAPRRAAWLFCSLGDLPQALQGSWAMVVCVAWLCRSKGICLWLLGLFLLLCLILSSALAMVLPSQVSNQMLWMISISLYKIWRDIFCREFVYHLPFLLLELSTVLVLPKKPAFFGYSNF